MTDSGVYFVLLPTHHKRAAEALQRYAEAEQHTSRAAPPEQIRNKPLDDWDRNVMHAVTKDGGFSFHDHIGDGPKNGYMVSIDKGSEETVPLKDVNPARIADYMSVHQQDLKDPHNYLGGWVYKGKVFLDVSRHVDDNAQAMRLANANKQLGIYDIGKGQTLMTDYGTQRQQRQQQTQQPRAAAVYHSASGHHPHYLLDENGRVWDLRATAVQTSESRLGGNADLSTYYGVETLDSTYNPYVGYLREDAEPGTAPQDRATAVRQGGVLTITFPDGSTVTEKGKRGANAAAISVGRWSGDGQWGWGVHNTVDAAHKNARTNSAPLGPGGQYWQHAHVVPVHEPEHTAVHENRRCESCGGAMPHRTHRQRDDKGRLVCDSCKGFDMPPWSTAHASLDVIAQSEMRRREAEAIRAITRVRRMQIEAASGKWETFRFYNGTLTGHRYVEDGKTKFEIIPTNGRAGSWDLMEFWDNGESQFTGETFPSVDEAKNWVDPGLHLGSKIAHDGGDNATIQHCPFCGSGAVVGNSDGSASCDFCHNTFTIQVQPNHPFMPQTVDGQGYTAPGMPGDQPTDVSSPVDPVADALDADQDPGQPVPDQGVPPGPNSNGPVAPGQPPSKQPPPPGKGNSQPPGGGGPPIKGGDKPTKDLPPWLQGKGDGKKKPDDDKDAKDSGGKKKSLPPWLKKKTLRTSTGAVLPAEEYMAHLALQMADDPAVVLDSVRLAHLQKAAVNWDACPDCQGSGEVFDYLDPATGRAETKICTRCQGTGTLDHDDPENFDLHPVPPVEGRLVTPEDCGAAGDGFTDDTAAFQRAMIQASRRPFPLAAEAAEGPNSRGLTHHHLPAEEVKEGDYLDSSGKVRVHNTHTRGNRVTLAWRLRGSKVPGVRFHLPGEMVHVWRRS